MFAVIKTGGKQYKVSAGDLIRVEKLEAEVGKTVEFKDVALLSSGDELITDPKTLEKTTVTGEVTRHGRAKKIVVGKYKKRKGYRRKQGHRQDFTELRISEIQLPG